MVFDQYKINLSKLPQHNGYILSNVMFLVICRCCISCRIWQAILNSWLLQICLHFQLASKSSYIFLIFWLRSDFRNFLFAGIRTRNNNSNINKIRFSFVPGFIDMMVISWAIVEISSKKLMTTRTMNPLPIKFGYLREIHFFVRFLKDLNAITQICRML